MSEKKDVSHGFDLIEPTLERNAGDHATAVTAPSASSWDTRAVWRREQDRALKQRLEQLKPSAGSAHLPSSDVGATSPPTDPEPAPFRGFSPHPPVTGIGPGGVLFFTALLSALAGGALTWLMMTGAKQHSQHSPATVKTAAAPIPTAVASAPAPMPVPGADLESRVLERVEHWRQAWVSRNIEAYLASYSPDFVPANGQSRTDWAAARQKNLSGKSDISVKISPLRVERLDNDQAKVVFLQDYASGTYRESAKPKTLLLVRAGADWQIAGEWQGEQPGLPASKK